MKKTSWQQVHSWYNKETKEKGHYYHEHVIIPRIVRMLNLHKDSRLLDVACGSGVLGRAIPKSSSYTGFDIAPGLIEAAKRQDNSPHHSYIVGDATQEWLATETATTRFTHAACVLAIQNIDAPEAVFRNVSRLLEPTGVFVIVMNHPAFRIPRQTSWGIDEQTKQQYRKIYRYMSPLEVPLTMHPGKGTRSPVTWSYHYPLSTYVKWLAETGFVLTNLDEWTSNRESQTGKTGKMENRSRSEIPLFLTLAAKKL